MRSVAPDLTLKEYQQLRAKTLDKEWDNRWPDGMYYLITMKAGGAVYGHMYRRSHATSYCREKGSTAAGFSGYYFGKGFAKHRVLSHKTYNTRKAWEEALKLEGI